MTVKFNATLVQELMPVAFVNKDPDFYLRTDKPLYVVSPFLLSQVTSKGVIEKMFRKMSVNNFCITRTDADHVTLHIKRSNGDIIEQLLQMPLQATSQQVLSSALDWMTSNLTQLSKK